MYVLHMTQAVTGCDHYTGHHSHLSLTHEFYPTLVATLSDRSQELLDEICLTTGTQEGESPLPSSSRPTVSLPSCPVTHHRPKPTQAGPVSTPLSTILRTIRNLLKKQTLTNPTRRSRYINSHAPPRRYICLPSSLHLESLDGSLTSFTPHLRPCRLTGQNITRKHRLPTTRPQTATVILIHY